ncbi:hypothetical protein ACQZV8_12545 [Magnetococcales bacterium HHB-1]
MPVVFKPLPLKSSYIQSQQYAFKAAIQRVNRQLAKNRWPTDFLAIGEPGQALLEIVVYLYALGWLREHVQVNYHKAVAQLSKNSEHTYMVNLLLHAKTERQLIENYLNHWALKPHTPQGESIAWLLHHRLSTAPTPENASETPLKPLIEAINAIWKNLNLFQVSVIEQVRQEQKIQKERTLELFQSADKARFELIDQQPNPPLKKIRFQKLGFIPYMKCPQSCRHCLFIWRPEVEHHPHMAKLFKQLTVMSENVLFTGGDLSQQMDRFYQTLRQMTQTCTFAILLNGDFATSQEKTRDLFQQINHHLSQRPRSAAAAKVTLQISFDEYHQEIISNHRGELRERIPVANIARIIREAPRWFPKIQLSLLHKQNHFNFSMDLFKKGVFQRLQQTLAQDQHELKLLRLFPSPDQKVHPAKPNHYARIFREAILTLNSYPHTPIHFYSSAIDALGRAQFLDPSTRVIRAPSQPLSTPPKKQNNPFDIEPMFWFNGWVTLFGHSLYPLGNVFDEGLETILNRWQKDPLLKRLKDHDSELIHYYQQLFPSNPLPDAQKTSRYHQFYQMVDHPEKRFKLTKALL